MANEIRIVITGDEKDAAAAIKAINQDVTSFGSTIKGVGTVAAGVLTADMFSSAARGAKDFIGSTVKAASDLGESVNAVQQVFGQSSKTITDWGDKNAEAFGLSKRAFNEAVTPMGALLKNTGLSMDDVSKDTLKLTQRAADMASVFNTSVPDALEAIQAGLRGESDPLEKYGVSLSAAKVQAQALAETHKTVASQLTTTELATARLNLIMKQTESTSGDFQRTSGGLANAQRIAAAQFEDAKAKLGAGLLPALAQAAKVAGEAAAMFAKIPGPLQTTIVVAAALAAGFVILAPRIIAAKAALAEMGIVGANVSPKMSGLAGAVGKASLALVALQIAGAIINSRFKELDPQVETLTADMEDFARGAKLAGEGSRVFGNNADELGRSLAAVGGSGFSHWMDGVSSSILSVFGADGDFKKAHEQVDAFDQVLAKLVQSGHAEEAGQLIQEMADKSKISVEKAKTVLPGYTAALEDVGRATKDAGGQAAQAADDFDALTKKLDETKKTADTTAGAFADKLFNAALDADNATLHLAESQTKLSDALKQNGKQLDIHTAKGQANREAILGVVESNIASYDWMIKSGYSAQQAAAAYDQNTEALRKQLSQAGLTKAQIDGLIGTYASVPDKVNTVIAANGLTKALNDLNELLRVINHLPPLTTITIEEVHRTSGGNAYGYTGHASGGIWGGWTGINEQGRELVKLPQGSMVYSHGDSERIASSMASGGGSTRFEHTFRFDPGSDTYAASGFQKMLNSGLITIESKHVVG